jgi:NodT family efflux transporter outer membrane factor (OMF) lipoprotein
MAAIANYDSLLVSLTAEVARTYILIRTFEARLAVARENVAIQERSLSIAQARFKGGAVSELDVQQAKAVLNGTLSSIPQLERGLRQARNMLSNLLGMAPGGVDARLGATGAIPSVPETVAVGIPADLLRRRPDIKKAELLAAAQSAKIGVAKADFFPTIALAGTIGLSTLDDNDIDRTAGDFFNADSLSYQYGLGIRWPILNYGRIKNKVRVQDARLQQLLVNYDKVVLNAAREVEDALVAFVRAQESARYLGESVKAYQRALEISLIQYRDGLVDYQRVLDTQRFLTRAQDNFTKTSGQVGINLIAVYKAIGGGWELRQGKALISEENEKEMTERTS